MSSKWAPWDFFKHHPKVIEPLVKRLNAVYCSDPYVQRILKNKLNFKEWDGESAHYVSGLEIDIEWIQENLQSLSLFGGGQSIVVLQAHSMSATVKNYLLENSISDGNRNIVFFFSNDKKFFNQWEKKTKDESEFLVVNEPRFWEMNQLLVFFADEMGIRLPRDIQNYLLEAVPHDSGEFVNALKTLGLNFGKGPYDLNKVKKVILPHRLDQFHLSSTLGRKDKKQFFLDLQKVVRDLEFDELIVFFNFMQSHLYKILDPSYTNKKAKLSKYDKEIQTHSKLWDKEELISMIRIFSELEIEAKKKNKFINQKVENYLFQQI